MAIEQLTSDAHNLLLPDPLGFRDPWIIGSEMSLLFGGAKQVRRRVGGAESLADRWRMLQFGVERVYQSPHRLVAAAWADGRTMIRVSPDIPALTLILQSYGDHTMLHQSHTRAPGVVGLTFTADRPPEPPVQAGYNWNFVFRGLSETAMQGMVYARAEHYPERLQIAAEAIAAICNIEPSITEELVARHYAPQGLDHARKVWDMAMQRRDRLAAARFILNTYLI